MKKKKFNKVLRTLVTEKTAELFEKKAEELGHSVSSMLRVLVERFNKK